MQLLDADLAKRLLNAIDVLRDWHLTLAEMQILGQWPMRLDTAADILADAILFGETIAPEAGRQLATLELGLVLADETADLVRGICP
jgi:hypothetical protein